MISYDWPRLRGRFGNQLFQYAFIRTTAQKLETKFFFPPWLGDKIFILNDDAERTDKDSSLQHFYREKISGERFDKLSLNIQDGTKIKGIFQSEDYFDRDDIIEWFKFKDNIFSNVVKKYNYIDFSDSTGIHLRFGWGHWTQF